MRRRRHDFNDAHVSTARADGIVTSGAYVLIYERRAEGESEGGEGRGEGEQASEAGDADPLAYLL